MGGESRIHIELVIGTSVAAEDTNDFFPVINQNAHLVITVKAFRKISFV